MVDIYLKIISKTSQIYQHFESILSFLEVILFIGALLWEDRCENLKLQFQVYSTLENFWPCGSLEVEYLNCFQSILYEF